MTPAERIAALQTALGVDWTQQDARQKEITRARINRWRAEGLDPELLALRTRREWSIYRDQRDQRRRSVPTVQSWSWQRAVALSPPWLYHVAPRWQHPAIAASGLRPDTYMTTEAGLPMWVQWMLSESVHRLSWRRRAQSGGPVDLPESTLRFLNRVRIYRTPTPPLAQLAVDSGGTADAQEHLAAFRRGLSFELHHPLLAVAVTVPGGVPLHRLEGAVATLLLEQDARRRTVRGTLSIEGPFQPLLRP